MSINRVVISGNLTRDPELRVTQSGMNILRFGMAVNERRRNQQTGEWDEYANFIDCVMFGARTDFMSRTLRKGLKVVVEGRLHYSAWEKDGQRRSKIEVYVDDVDFVSPRQSSGYDQGGYDSAPAFNAPRPASTPSPAPQRSSVAAPQQTDDVYDEDIPF